MRCATATLLPGDCGGPRARQLSALFSCILLTRCVDHTPLPSGASVGGSCCLCDPLLPFSHKRCWHCAGDCSSREADRACVSRCYSKNCACNYKAAGEHETRKGAAKRQVWAQKRSLFTLSVPAATTMAPIAPADTRTRTTPKPQNMSRCCIANAAGTHTTAGTRCLPSICQQEAAAAVGPRHRPARAAVQRRATTPKSLLQTHHKLLLNCQHMQPLTKLPTASSGGQAAPERCCCRGAV